MSILAFYFDIVRALEEINAPYMLIGAFAASGLGISRATFDIDMVVDLKEAHFEALASRFPPLTLVLLALGAALLAIALWLALRARRGQQRSGLPQGRLVYADTGRWSAVADPYFSQRHRLAGKPDYLVESDDGLVPVEVKRTAAPAGGQAYESHVMQLAAYCLLVEEAHGEAPAYGLIRYDGATVQIDYTPMLRSRLLELLEEVRASRGLATVGRTHRDAARCRACGVRHACGAEALV